MYLTIKTNEGNLPTLTFDMDRKSGIETFYESARQLDKYSKTALLYEVGPDGSNTNLAAISCADGEFFNSAKRDTWYPARNVYDIRMDTLDEDGERTFREFLMDVIQS